jgi:hypothetical protein
MCAVSLRSARVPPSLSTVRTTNRGTTMTGIISSLLITTAFALTLGVATASLSAVADLDDPAPTRLALAETVR